MRLLSSLAGEIQLPEEAETSGIDWLPEVWVKEPLVTSDDEVETETSVEVEASWEPSDELALVGIVEVLKEESD